MALNKRRGERDTINDCHIIPKQSLSAENYKKVARGEGKVQGVVCTIRNENSMVLYRLWIVVFVAMSTSICQNI